MFVIGRIFKYFSADTCSTRNKIANSCQLAHTYIYYQKAATQQAKEKILPELYDYLFLKKPKIVVKLLAFIEDVFVRKEIVIDL